MDMKKFLFAAVGVFVFVFLYEFLVHGFLMISQYEQTAAVWRPQAESSMGIMLLSQFLFGVAIAFFYPIVGPDTECKKAIPFGIGLGLVMAMPRFHKGIGQLLNRFENLQLEVAPSLSFKRDDYRLPLI